MPGRRASTSTMPCGVLVGEHAEHERRPRRSRSTRRVPRRAPRRRAGCARRPRSRSDRRRPAAAGRATSRSRGPPARPRRRSHGAAADERLDRGDRDGGVLSLVPAEERQHELEVLARESADRDELTADRDVGSRAPRTRRPRVRRSTPSCAAAASSTASATSVCERRDDGCRGLDDARLRAGDLLDGGAEAVLRGRGRWG